MKPTARSSRKLIKRALSLLLAVAIGGETVAYAQPVPTARLVQPSELVQVSSSPSGLRVAGLMSEPSGHSDLIPGRLLLVVAQWQSDRLRPVVSTYYLGKYQSIASYRWFDDNYLLIQVEGLLAGWLRPVVAGIPDDTWRPLPLFTHLIRYPWGDQDHALLQESGRDCRSSPTLSFCLFSLNVNHWGGELISGPLTLLPVEFLPVSPTEIYASGRSIQERHEEYRLDSLQHWRRVPEGTVARLRASLKEAQQASAALMAAAARAGIRHPTFVTTARNHRVVGIIGRAPEPAFVALDPKLRVVQTWLAKNYPTARVSISGLDDSLTGALIIVSDTDLPPTPFFLRPDGAVLRYELGSPRIAADRLGRTHMEPLWAPGEAVTVTLPPAGVALRGTVVTPVLASASVLQDPLHHYDAQVQAFAQQGIAVVQLLVPIPDAFASDAEGAAWRAAFDQHLQEVVEHASAELLHGEPVCLYGERLAGELALAAGLSHVGCVAAVNAILNARQLSHLQVTGLPVGVTALEFRRVGPSTQMLHREFPAVFGNLHDGLNESVSWVASLPRHVMLAYDAVRFTDAMRDYTVGNFADGSAAFRAAARKAGRHVTFYEPPPRFLTFLQRDARMIDATTHYVRDYYASQRRQLQ